MEKLENKERVLMLSLVNQELRKGETEGNPTHQWNGKEYKKDRKKYGLAKMTTLYGIKSKLTLNK